MDYAQDKRYTIPSAFTALNGSAQTFTLTAAVNLVAAEDATDLVKAAAQANLLRVLEVLRSNGAQPVITKVEGTEVTFTLEQSWVYGLRAPAQVQVSARKLESEAIADIEKLFKNVKALEVGTDAEGKPAVVTGTTDLYATVVVDSTIGALEEEKADAQSSAS